MTGRGSGIHKRKFLTFKVGQGFDAAVDMSDDLSPVEGTAKPNNDQQQIDIIFLLGQHVGKGASQPISTLPAPMASITAA